MSGVALTWPSRPLYLHFHSRAHSSDKGLIQTAVQIQNKLPEECVGQITDTGLRAFRLRWIENLLTTPFTEFDCWTAANHVIGQPVDWNLCISLSYWSLSQSIKKKKTQYYCVSLSYVFCMVCNFETDKCIRGKSTTFSLECEEKHPLPQNCAEIPELGCEGGTFSLRTVFQLLY